MHKYNLLPLNLQFFAEDTGGAGQGQTGQQTTDPQPGAGGAGTPSPEDGGQGKAFTQEELNSFLAKQKNDTQAKLLKQFGADSVDAVKARLTKFEEWESSQKTEAEKQAVALQKTQEQFNQTIAENEALKAQMSAMKSGVKADSVEDVVTLARSLVNDETPIDEAIKKVVEKYPHFSQEAVDKPNVPKFVQPGTGQSTGNSFEEQFLAAFAPKKTN